MNFVGVVEHSDWTTDPGPRAEHAKNVRAISPVGTLTCMR